MIKFALGILVGFFYAGLCHAAKDEPIEINSKIISGNGKNYEVIYDEQG